MSLSVPALDLCAQSLPPHWQAAPAPAAPLYRLDDDSLIAVRDARRITLSAALTKVLREAASDEVPLRARFVDGGDWRLWRASATGERLWRAQSLGATRHAIVGALRRTLAPLLADCVLHELRGPINALSLHTDLVGHLIERPGPLAAAEKSIRIVKDNLRGVQTRQSDVIALWLGDETADDTARVTHTELWRDTLGLLRGYYALREVRLPVEEALPSSSATLVRRIPFQLALLASLVPACDVLAADGGRGHELHLPAARGVGAFPDLPLPLGHPVAEALEADDADTLASAFAVLLEHEGITVDIIDDRRMMRWTLPAHA